MREQDIILLARFVNRTHSLTGSELQTSITSFIAGYEIGTDLRCNFTEILTKKLEEEHQIERSPSGWPKQVEIFAEKEKLPWFDVLKKITLEILEAEIDKIETKNN